MKNFFLENSGYSLMRLISFISVIAGCITCVIIILMAFMQFDINYLEILLNMCIVFLGFGFGGKLMQKFQEFPNA